MDWTLVLTARFSKNEHSLPPESLEEGLNRLNKAVKAWKL